MTFGLSDTNLHELRTILTAFPHIEQAVIYGSRARGDHRRGSDVDLALKGTALTRRDIALLDAKLEESYIPYFFDTCIYAQISDPVFRASIDRDGIIIYQQQGAP